MLATRSFGLRRVIPHGSGNTTGEVAKHLGSTSGQTSGSTSVQTSGSMTGHHDNSLGLCSSYRHHIFVEKHSY